MNIYTSICQNLLHEKFMNDIHKKLLEIEYKKLNYEKDYIKYQHSNTSIMITEETKCFICKRGVGLSIPIYDGNNIHHYYCFKKLKM